MRKIKFRAWDKKEKRMIKSKEIARLHFDNGLCYAVMGWEGQVLLKKFELIQYTGLKDKNGKEIYEGDIVLENNKMGTVDYGKGCFCIKPSWKGLRWINDGENIEIIGNIYENPELLKGVK